MTKHVWFSILGIVISVASVINCWSNLRVVLSLIRSNPVPARLVEAMRDEPDGILVFEANKIEPTWMTADEFSHFWQVDVLGWTFIDEKSAAAAAPAPPPPPSPGPPT